MIDIPNYWSKEQITAVQKSTTFQEIGSIALEVAQNMPKPIEQVCGPISTGGIGSCSLEENMFVFEKTILKLHKQGKIIFNQIPFERPIQRIREKIPTTRGYHFELLDEIYLPLFESGFISKIHLIYGWQSSIGATWEHKQAKRLKIKINYLPEDFVPTHL